MKKLGKIALIFFIVLTNAKYSFTQVQIILQQPPPNQLHLEDLWKLTLVNMSRNPYSIYLVGNVTERSRGEVLSAMSKIFSLPQGSKIVNSSELGAVNVNYQNTEIEDMIKKTGSIPSGFYTICISAYSSPDNQLVGETCINHEVNNMTIPSLISPLNASIVTDPLPVFSWMPPSPLRAGQRITYTLKIAEILPRQTPSDALLSNPEWFEVDNLISSIAVYPLASRMLIEGKKYAWKVKAYLNGVFLNESEIREFTYNSKYNTVKQEKPQKKRETKTGEIREFEGDNHSSYDMHLFNQDRLRASANDFFKLKSRAGGLRSSQIKKQPAVIFKGTSKITGQNSNRMATDSQQPEDFLRWEFNPSILIYNVPFSASLLLTTEQKSSKQNINNFSLNFDPNQLIEQIKNKAIKKSITPEIDKEYNEINTKLQNKNISNEEREKLNKRLKELEKIKSDAEDLQSTSDPDELITKANKNGVKTSGFTKFLLSFRNLGIGTNYPSFTEFTLDGIPLTGVNVEVNPGLLYFAFSGIRNLKPIQKSGDSQPVYGRKAIGTRLGIGKYDGTHLYLTHVYIWDDENSIIPDSSTIVTPMKDHVLGLQFKALLFKDKLDIDAETGTSLLTRDVRSPDIKNSNIPSLIQNIFGINISSSIDYFYSLKTSFDLDKTGTKLSAGLKMVGPGYISLGTPTLRNDNLEEEVKVDQKLFDNQVSISSFLQNDRDNLISWKQSTTSNTSFGFLLGINFPGYPFLSFNYSPFSQKNNQNADSLKIDNKISLYTLSTGYGYSIGKLFAFSNLTLTLQESKTFKNLSDFSTNTFLFNQSITFSSPLTITGGLGLTEIRLINRYNKIIYYDLNSSYTFPNSIQLTGGLNIANEMKENNKVGVFLESTIPIWIFGTLDVRAEKNIYNDNITNIGNYDEFVFKATLNTKW